MHCWTGHYDILTSWPTYRWNSDLAPRTFAILWWNHLDDVDLETFLIDIYHIHIGLLGLM